MIRIAFGQIQVHPGEPATNFQSMMHAIVPQWVHDWRLVGPSALCEGLSLLR